MPKPLLAMPATVSPSRLSPEWFVAQLGYHPSIRTPHTPSQQHTKTINLLPD